MKTQEKVTLIAEKFAFDIQKEFNVDISKWSMGLWDQGAVNHIVQNTISNLSIETSEKNGYTLVGLFYNDKFLGAGVVGDSSIEWETSDINDYNGTKSNF